MTKRNIYIYLCRWCKFNNVDAIDLATPPDGCPTNYKGKCDNDGLSCECEKYKLVKVKSK